MSDSPDYSRLPALPALEHPWVESGESPYYATTWPEASSEQDIRQYMDAINAWIPTLHSPWATVIDLSALEPTSSTAAQRKAFADGAKVGKPLYERYCHALSIVAPSAIVRGIATAVMWFTPAPAPLKLFATREEAEHWAKQQLAQAAQTFELADAG